MSTVIEVYGLRHCFGDLTAADHVEFQVNEDEVFGFLVPTLCPDIPPEILNPRDTWRDKEAYDRTKRELASQFLDNFRKYEGKVSPEILKGAPRL